MDNENLGYIIKKARIDKRLTQEKLGEMIGANKGSISRWENNEITNMGIDKAKELCKVLGLSPLIFLKKDQLENVECEEISPQEFKNEVVSLLYRCSDFTEKEKQMLISNLDFICSTKE